MKLRLFASLSAALAAAGAMVAAVTSPGGGPVGPPDPTPTCVRVVDIGSGEGSWYCGEVIRVPAGSRVIEDGLVPCAEEDGSSGPLPCRWDARTRGTRRGGSFTILPDGDPVNGTQPVLFRYDNGVTVHGSVQR